MPGPSRQQAATIEIENEQLVSVIYLHVIRIEIGVTDAVTMEAADTGADGAPEFSARVVLQQTVGKGADPGRTHSEEIRRVEHPALAGIPGGSRARNRQVEFSQAREKPPFREGACALGSQPEVAIAIKVGGKTAAPVVPQDEFRSSIGDEVRSSAAGRAQRPAHRRCRVPGIRVEGEVGNLVDERTII